MASIPCSHLLSASECHLAKRVIHADKSSIARAADPSCSAIASDHHAMLVTPPNQAQTALLTECCLIVASFSRSTELVLVRSVVIATGLSLSLLLVVTTEQSYLTVILAALLGCLICAMSRERVCSNCSYVGFQQHVLGCEHCKVVIRLFLSGTVCPFIPASTHKQ
jgi:hypothetical protein